VTQYDIAAPTRICAATGKELKPGDAFFAVLLEVAGKFVRKDFAVGSQVQEPGAIASWTGKIPANDKPHKPVFNDELLIEWFDHLGRSGDANRLNIRYVVALLLMRRKRLKFEDLKRSKDGDTMILRDARTGTRHEIADPRLTETEIAAVQDEVFQALGWQ